MSIYKSFEFEMKKTRNQCLIPGYGALFKLGVGDFVLMRFVYCLGVGWTLFYRGWDDYGRYIRKFQSSIYPL